ncbi:MAG: hypothetical protein HY077_03230 [Elusimicrobia bacterium]|nr:hypothetical protein [Elusimicrobiota bacterium]
MTMKSDAVGLVEFGLTAAGLALALPLVLMICAAGLAGGRHGRSRE